LISSRDEITPDPIITHKNTRNRIRKSLNKHWKKRKNKKK